MRFFLWIVKLEMCVHMTYDIHVVYSCTFKKSENLYRYPVPGYLVSSSVLKILYLFIYDTEPKQHLPNISKTLLRPFLFHCGSLLDPNTFPTYNERSID